MNTDELTFGSDDEKALINAIKTNFPQSGFLLCTKHIKENIRNYLQQSGCSQSIREQILHIFFNNKDGLVVSGSNEEFDPREETLEYYFENYPKFKIYYERYLKTKLKFSVYMPMRDNVISKLMDKQQRGIH